VIDENSIKVIYFDGIAHLFPVIVRSGKCTLLKEITENLRNPYKEAHHNL
jgi:hypothetical protein